MPQRSSKTNLDEHLYQTKSGNYHKGLRHNEVGEVDPKAYSTFLHTLATGKPNAFEDIPLGGNAKLSNPQGGLAFDLEGCDSQQTSMAVPPTLISSWRASEMVEEYWMAVLRDVNFADYPSNSVAAAAVEELSKQSDFRGPKHRDKVTPQTLFRGCMLGDLVGPYVSQFLLQSFNFGALPVTQRYRMEALQDYGLNLRETADVLKQVQDAIAGWREESIQLNIPKAEQDLMANAFPSVTTEAARCGAPRAPAFISGPGVLLPKVALAEGVPNQLIRSDITALVFRLPAPTHTARRDQAASRTRCQMATTSSALHLQKLLSNEKTNVKPCHGSPSSQVGGSPRFERSRTVIRIATITQMAMIVSISRAS